MLVNSKSQALFRECLHTHGFLCPHIPIFLCFVWDNLIARRTDHSIYWRNSALFYCFFVQVEKEAARAKTLTRTITDLKQEVVYLKEHALPVSFISQCICLLYVIALFCVVFRSFSASIALYYVTRAFSLCLSVLGCVACP